MYNQPHTKPNFNAPALFIPIGVKQRLDAYIQLCNQEISGLGTLRVVEGGFQVQEIALLEQVVTGASTDLDPAAVAGYMEAVMGRGDDPASIKLWWHSHAGMSTFWSGTDEATIRGFANGWMVSLVGNHHGEYMVRLDLYEPIRWVLNDLPLKVIQPRPTELEAAILAEIAAKVRRFVRPALPVLKVLKGPAPVNWGYVPWRDLSPPALIGECLIGEWWKEEE